MSRESGGSKPLTARAFGNPYGRAWWRINRAAHGYPEAAFARALNTAVEATDGDLTLERIEALREALVGP